VPGRLHPPSLRVGMACGPAAGAVIGAHRAFYCLYGDVINTAARMCKHAAAAGAADVHADAAAAAAAAAAGGVRCRRLGTTAVKGKGLMETCDLALEPDAPADPGGPRRSGRLSGEVRRAAPVRVAKNGNMSWMDLEVSRVCLAYISRTSRVHLAYISRTSRVHLAYISRASRVHLVRIWNASPGERQHVVDGPQGLARTCACAQ
jgi:hypothetical protein